MVFGLQYDFLNHDVLIIGTYFFLRKGMTKKLPQIQYIPRNMHTVFALLCFVVVIHWLIFPYPSGLLDWHCGNLMIAPVPAKQPWWIWINTSCEFIMNDCITTTKQSTTKPCAYFLGYTVPKWDKKQTGVWIFNVYTISASILIKWLPVRFTHNIIIMVIFRSEYDVYIRFSHYHCYW